MGAVISQLPTPRRLLMTADAVGGVWTYALELARSLAEWNVEVALAVLGPRPSPGQMIAAERLPNCRVLLGDGHALEWMDDPWEDVDRTGPWLLKVAEDFRPDVVHLNEFGHVGLPWTCPVVLVAHSCVLTWWRSVKGEAAPAKYDEYRRRAQEALRMADVVVAPTTAFRKQLAREHEVSRPLETIPNARDAQSFHPTEKLPRIISAGRLWDEGKNLQLLDRIAGDVEWEIAIAGETEQENVRPFAGKRLRHLGRLAPGELTHELGAAAIYASPALYEPFGLAILEAALSGCALVLSDLPSLRENWEGCARFVAPDDGGAWTAALNELARNDVERRWLQSRARARALAFNPARQAAAYHRLYASLLATAPSRAAFA
jgi:glycogen synthase